MRKKSEHTEQVAIFDWANRDKIAYPELQLLFSVPNGGHRHIGVAKKLKAEGVKSGVPDMFLPVARGDYHGMFVELKYGKNKTSDNQELWLKSLSEQGYYCVVCYGYDKAKAAIVYYLALPVNN